MVIALRKAGFVRARVDGTVYNLDEEISLDRYKIHTIEAVVDRLVIGSSGTDEDRKADVTRLTDSIETSLKFGHKFREVFTMNVFSTAIPNRFVGENPFLSMPQEEAPIPTFSASKERLPSPFWDGHEAGRLHEK